MWAGGQYIQQIRVYIYRHTHSIHLAPPPNLAPHPSNFSETSQNWLEVARLRGMQALMLNYLSGLTVV